MTTYKVIHAGKRDGFEIQFEFSNESLPLTETLDCELFDCDELAREIDQGDLAYFTVTCVAKINEVRLGSASLGACLYDREEEFLADDYAADLESEAINEAKQSIGRIVERVA